MYGTKKQGLRTVRGGLVDFFECVTVFQGFKLLLETNEMVFLKFFFLDEKVNHSPPLCTVVEFSTIK